MEKYKFNPLDHGYEPISKYPELSYMFPMMDDIWSLKIIVYDDLGGLVYWYSAISLSTMDDRIKIFLGSHDTRKPTEYERQNGTRTVYHGLISSDEYAKQLLTHLFGTPHNDSVEICGVQRYNENLGVKMRSEFKK